MVTNEVSVEWHESVGLGIFGRAREDLLAGLKVDDEDTRRRVLSGVLAERRPWPCWGPGPRRRDGPRRIAVFQKVLPSAVAQIENRGPIGLGPTLHRWPPLHQEQRVFLKAEVLPSRGGDSN